MSPAFDLKGDAGEGAEEDSGGSFNPATVLPCHGRRSCQVNTLDPIKYINLLPASPGVGLICGLFSGWSSVPGATAEASTAAGLTPL